MKKLFTLFLSAVLLSTGITACGSVETPRKSVFPDNAFKEIPAEYLKVCDQGGKLLSVTYQTKNYSGNKEEFEKKAFVYVPYGYDATDTEKKYDVMYMMHGGGGSEKELFGGLLEENNAKMMLDNMIANGDLEPCLVVTPSYNNPYNGDATQCCKFFWEELVNDLIPAVETKFNTYLEKTSKSGIKATRLHRGFGGFSMGAACTWWVFENALDYVGYFLPVAGDSWALGQGAGGYNPDGTVEYLANVVRDYGYDWEDFYIYCGVGSNDDMAGPNMKPMLNSMKKDDYSDVFKFAENFADGNCYFIIREGGWHDQNTVHRVMFNGLPKFFG